ncbi:MAG: hypothetical protein QOF35_1411 [Actinomycetota bacterium]|jgi:hypothetical protein|nr:hypothetical protein [Actinomycetota bacterium]
MVQQPNHPHDRPTDFDHHVVLFPTRPGSPSGTGSGSPSGTRSPARPAITSIAPSHSRILSAIPAPSSSPAGIQPRVLLKGHLIRQVVVLEVTCPLGDVVEELDRAIQLALADEPRGVVCDLSAVSGVCDSDAVDALASAGRHVRDWPGIPVAVACPDPLVREALRAHPLGGYLMVTESLFSAISAVLDCPALAVERLRLAPHPTAPRAAREFVARTLLDWRLGRVIPFASLVVSELVASSSNNAGTEIDLSVVWHHGALRLAVRDHGPALPGQEASASELTGRKLTVVAGLSRLFGILPTSDGGSVVWAVLGAPSMTAVTTDIADAPSRSSC